MARIHDVDSDEKAKATPEELVIAAFLRCQNWPKDRIGIMGLAQGLKNASERFFVTMEEIVTACAEASTYCPTDYDLLTIASQLAAKKQPLPEIHLEINGQRVSKREWEEHYGKPKPFDWTALDRERVDATKNREAKMLREIKKVLGLKWGKSSWTEMADLAEKLGYPEYAKAWRRGVK